MACAASLLPNRARFPASATSVRRQRKRDTASLAPRSSSGVVHLAQFAHFFCHRSVIRLRRRRHARLRLFFARAFGLVRVRRGPSRQQKHGCGSWSRRSFGTSSARVAQLISCCAANRALRLWPLRWPHSSRPRRKIPAVATSFCQPASVTHFGFGTSCWHMQRAPACTDSLLPRSSCRVQCSRVSHLAASARKFSRMRRARASRVVCQGRNSARSFVTRCIHKQDAVEVRPAA